MRLCVYETKENMPHSVWPNLALVKCGRCFFLDKIREYKHLCQSMLDAQRLFKEKSLLKWHGHVRAFSLNERCINTNMRFRALHYFSSANGG